MPPEIDQWKLTKTQNELLQIREKAQNDARKIAEDELGITNTSW
jgi:hypothetical protein